VAERVAVFIDGMNMYRGARDAFFSAYDPHTAGQFDPMQLAQAICRHGPPPNEPGSRVLSAVRIYQGTPSSHDRKGYAADQRHRSAWEKKGITVVTRPLRYDGRDSPPHEKGIDVALAIDLVAMGIDGDYDVGVLASADTDLLPALEYLFRRGVRVETAAWRASTPQNLIVSGTTLWPHYLRRNAYNAVADYRDYNLGK